MKIFICNLPYETGARDLRELFQRFGPVRHVRLLVDKETSRPLGRAMVFFKHSDDAERSVAELNGQIFKGRGLLCRVVTGDRV